MNPERRFGQLEEVMAEMLQKQDRLEILAIKTFEIAENANAKVDALDAKLSERIDGLDTKLSSRIDALDGKVDGLDAKLSSRIDALDGKVDALDTRLTSKVDTLARALANLTIENKEAHQRMNDKNEELHQQTNDKLDTIMTFLREKFS